LAKTNPTDFAYRGSIWPNEPESGQTKHVPSYSIRKFYARPPPVASVSLV
jgi:hypothetical protein